MTINALIIDDSPMARRIIRHHLTKFGCRIAGEAESASYGMRLFAELKTELVTLDIMMPAMHGIGALETFRAIRREAPATAVLIVSSMAFDRTRDTFLKEGALAYLVKLLTPASFEPVGRKLTQYFSPPVNADAGASLYTGVPHANPD